MTDERKRKKTAQVIQAMLELDGIKTTIKEVLQKIEEEEDLSNVMVLKNKLANDMRSNITENMSPNDRRSIIGDFFVTNWNLLKDNEVVKSALLNAYCMGRYNKEQRETMTQELLNRVGVKVPEPEQHSVEEKFTEEVESQEDFQDYRNYVF